MGEGAMGLSAVKVRLFQFAKEAFRRKVIGVCFLLPEGEMSVVVQFVLLLPKGFHIARYLRFLEHLVHAFGEVAFLLTFPYHVEVSVSAMQPCSASFNSLPLPREYNITNMTAAKRYESVWNAFLNELSHNPTATLTSFLKRCNVRQGRMKRWMENNGLSVKEAKKRLRDCQHDGIGDPMSPLSEDPGSLFLPMATDKPAPRSESCDILFGVSLTFPDGTQVNIKRGSAQAVMSFLKLYQREDLPCLD